ncbi:MAG: hypothetical protein WAW88_05340 [Nocardioides sp.]
MWLDLLGWGGSALLVFSLLQARVLRFRVLNLIACIILIAFNLLLGIWPMVGMNVVLSAINIYFIAKLLRERHDEASYEVLAVRPDDAYLRHVLAVHGTDIARFNPGFSLDVVPGSHPFLVQRGDETVGVVMLQVAGSRADILLDYVTPRFRDFSPGEFVWRRSGLLSDLGVREVVTRPRMIDAYYARVGFQRTGENYTLTL